MTEPAGKDSRESAAPESAAWQSPGHPNDSEKKLGNNLRTDPQRRLQRDRRSLKKSENKQISRGRRPPCKRRQNPEMPLRNRRTAKSSSIPTDPAPASSRCSFCQPVRSLNSLQKPLGETRYARAAAPRPAAIAQDQAEPTCGAVTMRESQLCAVLRENREARLPLLLLRTAVRAEFAIRLKTAQTRRHAERA